MSFRRILQQHRNGYWVIVMGGFLGAVALIFFENDSFYRDFTGYFDSSPPLAIREFRAARVTIDFGNGTKRAFEGESQAGMTILSALRLSGDVGQFKTATNERGAIVAIAGVGNAMGKRWRVYRNGAAVEDLPGHIGVEAGDRIMLRYE